MTEPPSPSPGQSPSECPQDGKDTHAVGYGRPPKESRFKPGQSGNPKGRPKESQNVKSTLRKLYMTKIVIHDGKKRRLVTRLEALLTKQWERAVKGNERATQAVVATAKMLGVFDETETDDGSYSGSLSRNEIKLLSNQALKEVIAIEKMRESKLKKH